MADQVLTSEEVDAILKVTKESQSNNVSFDGSPGGADQGVHSTVTGKLSETVRFDYEKSLSAFLRKKIFIKLKDANFMKIGEALKAETPTPAVSEATETPDINAAPASPAEQSLNNVYAIFRISPTDSYGMCVLTRSLLYPVINLLYGGQPGVKDSATEAVGKLGLIIAEKISQLLMASVAQACVDQGTVTTEMIKTTMIPHLISHVTMEDSVFAVDFSLTFDGEEIPVKLLLPEEFLREFVFVNIKTERKHREKDFWRTAIKTQVVDSMVNVAVTLPDVQIKVNEFMGLKAGDVIPISDPTLVYVCLNSLKLFRAKAGQSNSKRVVKILTQI